MSKIVKGDNYLIMGSYEYSNLEYEPIVNKVNLLGGFCITSEECYKQADLATGKKINAVYRLVELLKSVSGVVFIKDISNKMGTKSENVIRSLANELDIKVIYPNDLDAQIAQLAEIGALTVKNRGVIKPQYFFFEIERRLI